MAQEELAVRLGPKKLAFLQQRAEQKRTTAAASAATMDDEAQPNRPQGVGAIGRYKPSENAGQAGAKGQAALAPELSEQQCEAGPHDVRKLVQERAGKGAMVCMLWPMRALK